MSEVFIIGIGKGFLDFEYSQYDGYYEFRFVDTAEQAKELFDKQVALKIAKDKGGKAYKKKITLEEVAE